MAGRLDDRYLRLLDGQDPLPSWLVALLPGDVEPPTVTEVLGRLEAGPVPLAHHEVAAEPQTERSRWQLDVGLATDPPRALRVWSERTAVFDDLHLEWRGMRPEDVAAAKASRWSLGTSLSFGPDPLGDFHLQLRLLAAVAPHAVAMYDVPACRPHPGAWLREATATDVPPSPAALFSIHAVFDENHPSRGIWLHTHGLLRCRSVELEMLEVPRDASHLLGELLNSVAPMFVECGAPDPGVPFLAGRDLPLVWLPWEEGVHRLPAAAQGGPVDRDPAHSAPSAILFAPVRRLLGLLGTTLRPPSAHLRVLEDNPVLYVSNMETRRMALLGRARLPAFLRLLAGHGGHEGWVFLVKLGFPVDQPESETDREHLWFEVHAVGDEGLDATLLNQPYAVARLREGQRGRHPLELLSDWAILSPHGRFGPDTVVHLERELTATVAPALPA